ncbi:hypothetical protein NST18_12130 [Anoxybacillus sp. FSL W8-0104]|uniref:5-methylcytosine restriction system specificity protein McrC n=1 Tax=unclassified Anoxybacillus TaxID=2639704 RepID=UPI0030F7824C
MAQNIIHTLADVSNIYITKDTFSLIREDRLLGEYSKLLRLAKMFLEGHSFDISDSHYKDNFIFNIDMNIVFQEYIYELIKEFSTDIFEQVSVFSQYGKSHLIYDKNDKGSFLLKPDIALVSNKRVIILIDTKYKILRKEQRRSGVSDQDVYQMFGYYHKYGKPKIYLLYPKYTDDISIAYKFENQEMEKLFINTIDLSKELYLPEGELAVLNQLKEIFSSDS